jgi:anti-sigma regulatory factor (Ser/Thr protein kinase)
MAGLKDLAFSLSVPTDPAFRPLAADAAGKYGETLGLSEPEAAALTASAQEAVDLAAAAGARDVAIDVQRDGDQLEITVAGAGTPSTLLRTLPATKST